MKPDGIRQTAASGESDDCRWEEFLRYASDRLKTPVTVMGLALQRMEEVQSEEERGEYLEMAKRGQQKLAQAVEEVLDIARKERGGNENDTKQKKAMGNTSVRRAACDTASGGGDGGERDAGGWEHRGL